MNLSPQASCHQQQEDDHQNETKTFTLNLDSVVITVTCTRPSVAAIANFTNTLHEILLNLLDDSQENPK